MLKDETQKEPRTTHKEENILAPSKSVINKLVEDYRSQNKTGLVFKIDFEKAYDNVDRGFLDSLRKENFWIKDCLSSVSYSVLINERPREKFNGFKGIR